MSRNWFSVTKALLVRCLLASHVTLCVWRVVTDLGDPMYWLLLCGLVPLLLETLYTVWRRQGVEFSRFTPCFLFYLGAVLPGIWLLELDKTDLYIHRLEQQSLTTNMSTDGQQQPPLTAASGGFVDSDILSMSSLNSATWIMLLEEMLPYILFVSRWVLPRGKVQREELAELLFAFMEMAADIMEFFSLFGEDVVRGNKPLAYSVLAIWSLSILQFTMTVTVVQQPKREKKVKPVVSSRNRVEEKERVHHECRAILLTIVMQDLPFAALRLYTIVEFNYISYSLIFFTSKNLIIIAILLYKVAALVMKHYWPTLDNVIDKADCHREVTERDHIWTSILSNGHLRCCDTLFKCNNSSRLFDCHNNRCNLFQCYPQNSCCSSTTNLGLGSCGHIFGTSLLTGCSCRQRNSPCTEEDKFRNGIQQVMLGHCFHSEPTIGPSEERGSIHPIYRRCQSLQCPGPSLRSLNRSVSCGHVSAGQVGIQTLGTCRHNTPSLSPGFCINRLTNPTNSESLTERLNLEHISCPEERVGCMQQLIVNSAISLLFLSGIYQQHQTQDSRRMPLAVSPEHDI